MKSKDFSLWCWLLRCHTWRPWPWHCFIMSHEMCQLIGCRWKSSSLSQSGCFLCPTQDYVHGVFWIPQKSLCSLLLSSGSLLHFFLRDLRKKAKLRTMHSSDPDLTTLAQAYGWLMKMFRIFGIASHLVRSNVPKRNILGRGTLLENKRRYVRDARLPSTLSSVLSHLWKTHIVSTTCKGKFFPLLANWG